MKGIIQKKNVEDLLNNHKIPWNSVTGKPTTFPPETHSHNYAANNHTHSYLPLSGGTMTGSIKMTGNKYISFKPETTSYDICGILVWNAESSHNHNFYGFKSASATCCGITAGIISGKCCVDSIDCGHRAWEQCTAKIFDDRENSPGSNIQLFNGDIVIGSYYRNEVYLGGYSSGVGLGISISGRTGGGLSPTKDNMAYLGYANYRWKYIYAATSTISTSDRNLKKDEKDFEDEFVTKLIMGLKPKTYKFKQNDSNRTHYGFIAQDIEELLPELGISSKDIAAFIKTPNTRKINVGSEENPISGEEIIPEGEEGYGFIYSLRYEELISPLVRKVQMQEEKINNMQKQIDQLIQSDKKISLYH